ncbi:hypothetical protein [Wenzhouxiangella sp. XN24]|uniref:hypothetical protein n=1 Tax=Wenzhouxiangella sp. XN24 TaxID=2713569 RepID=UPI0013EB39DC|nr:hypothetical protein [Wenzhouxiangella sp. XN24]NGX15864.1 hypothetical protein [Wenzhouxiangella sp. XN24]
MKTTFMLGVALLFAYLLGLAMLLLVGHRGGWFIALLTLGLVAIGWTAWLLRPGAGPSSIAKRQ